MLQSINPATEEIIREYTPHTDAQVEQRLTAAVKAFSSWKAVPLRERAEKVRGIAAVLRRRKVELAKLMTAEVGKPIGNSEGEVEKCAVGCEWFADNAERLLTPKTIASDASQSYVRLDPLGPILAIMPWNFPLWQVFRFAAPALVGGNVGVLKHAPNVIGTGLAIESVISEAGFPAGVFTLAIVENERAEQLITHSAIRGVTLTGSERAGSAVAAVAGRALKKTVMELGGSDPFIVLADADVASVAKAAAEARCLNNGQSCIAAKRFIVEKSIAEAFENEFTRAMAAMKLGDPTDRSTQVGPMARLDLLEGLHRQVIETQKQGATIRTGGKRRDGKGYFYEPTVLTNVKPGMAAFEQETFGPVAAVIRAENADDAIRLANQTAYGLGASIWTANTDLAQQLAVQIEAGNVFINGDVKSDPRLPFGGVKNSGWGRELSNYGIEEFMNIKTVWVK